MLLKIEQSFKTCEFTKEREFHDACGAVALFGNDQFGEAGVFIRRLVKLFAVDEHHDIRILLNRTRLTQVGKLRLVVTLALLGGAAQL